MYSLRLAIRQGKPGWIQNPRVVYTQLGPNFWDGLSGFATLASEWWFWEFIGFASAHLGHSALAAHSIVGMPFFFLSDKLLPAFFSHPYFFSGISTIFCPCF
jgi:hypothetical protein